MENNIGYFVTGIGTEVGKTYTCELLCKRFGFDYWKPIQCGDLDQTDSMRVQQIQQNHKIQIFEERYALKTPASPHLAAANEQVEISISDFKLPNSKKIIVEGAGGLLVPLNSTETMLDLIKHLDLPVILVSKNYLGSINHTLLTYYCLKNENIPIKGIVFNGQENTSTESIILSKTNLDLIGRIDENDQEGKWFCEL